MRIHFWCFAALAAWSTLGCGGRGGQVTPPEPSLREFLAEFEVALMDAQGTVESAESAAATRRQSSESEGDQEEDPPEVMIRGVLENLNASADQLVQSAAGHSAESDVKAIQADTQALLQKAQGMPNPADVLQGLQQLSAKAESLKSKL